jgi:putative two-component system response regulator
MAFVEKTTENAIEPTQSGVTDACNRHADANKNAKIAIIDDEPINVKIVRKHLQGVGYENFVTSSDSVTAAEMIFREKPDVVLLDVMMPQIDGIQILQTIRAREELAHIPVLILTASTDSATKLKALNAGATDFLAKPVDPNDLIPRIRNALVVKAHQDNLAHYSEELERQVRARTTELELSRLQVVHCLARAGEFRDDTTGRHVIRVGRYATILGRELGFNEDRARMLGLAALLHDLGKIGLPDSILLKPGPLEPAEREAMKRHCEMGSQIVEPLTKSDLLALVDYSEMSMHIDPSSHHPLLDLAGIVTRTHHERWDGTGYPSGLKGEQIPIEGRIVAVADVFDALGNARPYKNALPPEKCLEVMDQDRGRHFDPQVLDALHRGLAAVLQVHNENNDVRAAA